LGVLPGIVGTLQALEVIKLILGEGNPLIGRLLLFDALKMKFRELKLRKDPECALCGERATIKELIDYEQFCGIPAHEPVAETRSGVPTITVEELKALMDENQDVYILDVREPQEWDIAHLDQAKLIPLGELPQAVNQLSSADDIVVHCRSGVRSARAVQFLMEMGFRKVRNLEGGILAWSERIDPSLPRY
jgi:adenylyltransferase/sulfurtransferase